MYVWRDVPAHEHGVEHDPQAPHVRRTPRVLGVRPDKEKKQKLVTSKVFVTGENTDLQNFISAFLYEYGLWMRSSLVWMRHSGI